MREINISTTVIEFDSVEELQEDEQILLNHAKSSALKAYSPYSGFSVGAALLLENGEIVLGNNQENSAYPSGMCAERVAFFAAGAVYGDVKIDKVAITASSSRFKFNNSLSPCGDCRQAMVEYEVKQEKPITLLLLGGNGKVLKVRAVKDLLPLLFQEKALMGS